MIQCPACGAENIEGAEACDECSADLTFLSKPKAQTPVDKLLHKTPVKMLREHPPVIVPRDRKVRDVIASLVLHKNGCAVVVDAEGAVVGVFSERDLLYKIAGMDPSLLDRPVEQFMTPDPVTVDADVPIAYAVHQMDLGGYRHVPVVRDRRPIAMVSVRDVLAYVSARFLSSKQGG